MTGPLAAESVSWSAGGRLVINGVSLVVADGETLGLLGPNGAGKSSMLRLLAGLRRADGGAVLLDDLPAPLGPSRPSVSPSRNALPWSSSRSAPTST